MPWLQNRLPALVESQPVQTLAIVAIITPPLAFVNLTSFEPREKAQLSQEYVFRLVESALQEQLQCCKAVVPAVNSSEFPASWKAI